MDHKLIKSLQMAGRKSKTPKKKLEEEEEVEDVEEVEEPKTKGDKKKRGKKEDDESAESEEFDAGDHEEVSHSSSQPSTADLKPKRKKATEFESEPYRDAAKKLDITEHLRTAYVYGMIHKNPIIVEMIGSLMMKLEWSSDPINNERPQYNNYNNSRGRGRGGPRGGGRGGYQNNNYRSRNDGDGFRPRQDERDQDEQDQEQQTHRYQNNHQRSDRPNYQSSYSNNRGSFSGGRSRFVNQAD